jgi:hypothetical protein
MRNTRFILGAVIVMLIPVAQAQAVGSPIQKGNRTVAQASNIESPPHATKGEAVVEAKSTVAPANEPEEHFRNARESFLEKNAKAAAAQIRKGAAFLKLEASHATGEVKEALTASVGELERLAQGVEKGTVTSTQELRRAFARADQALAKQHFQDATESWSKKEIKKAGQELKSAANDVELASAWTGRKLDATTAAAIKDARAVAAKLTEDAGWTTGEVSKGLNAVGKKIENLGKQI